MTGLASVTNEQQAGARTQMITSSSPSLDQLEKGKTQLENILKVCYVLPCVHVKPRILSSLVNVAQGNNYESAHR